MECIRVAAPSAINSLIYVERFRARRATKLVIR